MQVRVMSHCFALSDILRRFLTDPDSSHGARVFQGIMISLFLLSVALTMSQHTSSPWLHNVTSAIAEILCETCVLAEVILRAYVCWSLRASAHDPPNPIDAMTALPQAFRAAVGFVLLDQDDEDVAS